MLSEQFFNRAQLTKVLDFKSVSMMQYLEKKGFIKPDIKPSKYSLIQVFFLFFCKELVEYTSFTWKELISLEFNKKISQEELYKKTFAYFFKTESSTFESFFKDDKIEPINLGDSSLLMLDNDILNRQFNEMYCSINDIKKIDDFVTIMIIPMKDNHMNIGVSLRRLKQKFIAKCEELNIDLDEKIPA